MTNNHKIKSSVDVCNTHRISGWIADFNQLQKQLQIKILIDDIEFCTVIANNYREDLNNLLSGTNHAFKVDFPTSICDGKEHEIKIVELETGYTLYGMISYKITKVFLLGDRFSIENSELISTKKLHELVGHNTGNLVYASAINQMLGGKLESRNWANPIDQVKTIGVLTLANQLGSHVDMGRLAKIYESIKCNLVGVGLGAQAINTEQSLELSTGTIQWVQNIQKHSISSAPNISLRGEFTYRILEKYKLSDKTVVLGCPSLFINPVNNLGALISSKFVIQPERIGVIAGNPHISALKKIEISLIRMIDKNNCAYICQHPYEMIQIGRGEVELLSQNTRDQYRQYIHPQLTNDEFISWCNEKARSFFAPVAWMEHLKQFDFVIGTRIHGIMLALQAGVPAVCITHDSRTQEMCETMQIPHVEAKNVIDGIKREDIPHLFNFDPVKFDKNRQFLAAGYINFFISNELNPADYLKILAK